MADFYVAKSKDEGWKIWSDASNSWHTASLQDLLNATMTLNESTGAYVPVDFKSAYNKGDRSGPIEWNAIKNTWVIKYGESLKPVAGNPADSESKKTATELRVLDENAVEDLLQKISRIVEGSPDCKAELKSFLKDLRGSVFDNLREETQSAAYDLTQALQASYQKLDDGVEEILEKVSEVEIPSLDYKKELRVFRESLEETVKKALREELREELKKELKPQVRDSVTPQKSPDILINPATLPNPLESFKKEILEDFKSSVKELGITASQKLEMREKFIREFEETIRPKLLADLEYDVRRQLRDRIENQMRRSLRDELHEKILREEESKIREQIINDAKYELLLGVTYEQAMQKKGSLAESLTQIFKTKALALQEMIWEKSLHIVLEKLEQSFHDMPELSGHDRHSILSVVRDIQKGDVFEIMSESFQALCWGENIQYFSKSDFLSRRARKHSKNVSDSFEPIGGEDYHARNVDEESEADDSSEDGSEEEELEQI
jgi:hypothetical protein